MGLIQTVARLAIPQIAVPLRLATEARAGATWLLAHPMTGLALVAAAFGAVEHHSADKLAALAGQRGTALAAVRSANSQAIQQATAAKDAKDASNSKLAAEGDRTAADLRDRYHAAVLQLAAAQDRARRPDLPGDAHTATSSDRPGDSTQVSDGSGSDDAGLVEPLAIGRDDALTCADNTARLRAVHDWAMALGQ